jgi:putative redox protein
MYASRHQWPLDKIAVTVRHATVPAPEGKTIDHFERLIDLTGRLTDEQRAQLLNIAEKCPISQTLLRPSIVVSSLTDVPLAVPA